MNHYKKDRLQLSLATVFMPPDVHQQLWDLVMNIINSLHNTIEARKVHGINGELVHITDQVLSATSTNPEKLMELKDHWKDKVQELTSAIDEIISAKDFTSASGIHTSTRYLI